MNDKGVHSVGETLRGAREAKGMTLEEVYQFTKISVDVLRALEEDDLDSFQSDIQLPNEALHIIEIAIACVAVE